MDDKLFKQKLILALVGNPEFIKHAKSDYNGKFIWHCVSEQINDTVNAIKIPKDKT